MWKSSVARSGESRWSGGERKGSFRGETKNGGSSGRGQQPPASTLGIVVDEIDFTSTEDVREERGSIASTKQNDRISSSSSSIFSNSSNSSVGGKFLQVLKRKVHVSSSASKASHDPSSHYAKEGGRKTMGRSHDEVIVTAFRGQSSVDKLEEELLTLRRKLEKREAEMQRLANEVSTLRVGTTTGRVESQPQSQELSIQAQEETSRLVNRSDSFCSDTSQLSCLDFSLGSTGDIKFEGEIKTKITPATSDPVEESGSQTTSILSDARAGCAPRLVEKLAKVNGGSTLKEAWRTIPGSPSSHLQEMEIVDKHVEATNKSLDESKAKISKPDYVGRYGINDIGGDFKSPETVKDPEDDFSDVQAKASRSPPSSASSSFSEEPDFTFPYLGPWTSSESHGSLVAEEPVLWKETDGMINCAPGVVELDLVKIGEEVDEKSLKVPLSNQAEDASKQEAGSKAASFSKEHQLTIQIPPMQDPLKVLMSSCVTHELDKLSKTMESLKQEESSKCPDRISMPASVLTPPHSVVSADQALPSGGTPVRRHSPHRISRSTSLLTPPQSVVPADEALPRRGIQVRQHSPDRISRSTSAFTPPYSGVPADQALIYGGTQVRRQSPNSWEMKEWNVLEQPRAVQLSWNKNAKDLESAVSTKSKSGIPTEPMVDHSRIGVENLPPPKSRGSNIYGTRSLTNSQPREYTVTTTAGHHESSSRFSSSIPPSAREVSPSRTSLRRQLSFDGPPGWKPDSGSADRVRLSVSFDLSGEKSQEEIDLEEEVRQCLEQSRLLLMSDASNSAIKHGTPMPVARETSFSVLAVSRQRRSMEKCKPAPRHSPERLDRHEQYPTFSSLYRKTTKTHSRKFDVSDSRALTGQESEDYFISNPSSMTNAVKGYYKKHAQSSCESGARDSNLPSPPSLPSRRSRFFIEANNTRFSQVA